MTADLCVCVRRARAHLPTGSVLYQILRLFKACVRRFCLCCFHQRKDEAAVPHTRRQTVTRARTKADFELDKERKLVYVQCVALFALLRSARSGKC